jgi:hypothetical protein
MKFGICRPITACCLSGEAILISRPIFSVWLPPPPPLVSTGYKIRTKILAHMKQILPYYLRLCSQMMSMGDSEGNGL